GPAPLFFSSRGRHTSFSRDWSSDVCSSDLPLQLVGGHAAQHGGRVVTRGGHDNQVAHPLEQIVDEAARVLTGLNDPVDAGEDTLDRKSVVQGKRGEPARGTDSAEARPVWRR